MDIEVIVKFGIWKAVQILHFSTFIEFRGGIGAIHQALIPPPLFFSTNNPATPEISPPPINIFP